MGLVLNCRGAFLWLLIVGLGPLLPVFGATAAPTISGYAATNPRGVRIFSAPPGAPLLIEGTNLGTSGTVAFNGVPAPPPASWSPTEILVTVPTATSYPSQGPVTVTTNGQSASGPAFTITPPPPPTTPPTPTTLRPGDLDPSFGTGGKVLTVDVAARAEALRADGRIVVAGYGGLARYTSNGALDPSFGSGGGVLTDFSLWAVALQPDGRIVVAGVVSGLFDEFVALARYTASGAPDPSFGSGGEVLTDFGGVFTTKSATLALQADGRIVVAGNAGLARYTSNGALDPSFGSGGKVLTDFSASALSLQADGRIVVAGYGGLAHYTSNGALDPSFGSGGEVSLDFSASAVALQPDGRIVVAGTRYDDVNINAYFALARYTANGTLDSSFGSTGELLTGFSDYPGGAAALALQPDGRIVAADMRYDVAGNNDYFWLARYTGSGAPDPSFGSGGEVLTDFGVTAAPIALALQQDGQIVVAGQMYDTCGTAFTLARFQSR